MFELVADADGVCVCMYVNNVGEACGLGWVEMV